MRVHNVLVKLNMGSIGLLPTIRSRGSVLALSRLPRSEPGIAFYQDQGGCMNPLFADHHIHATLALGHLCSSS